MSDEREFLSLAMQVFGQDGRLIMFKDSEDPFDKERAQVALQYAEPFEEPITPLRKRLAEVNARSRGNVL
ncbi:hypothetical protein [Streptomyces sp. NPDC059874]|uniref:hypothetical protein n=1 Tax=Streptomyces sp. NPDC059874 TaxID=3346983 RepID=UPI00364FAD2E